MARITIIGGHGKVALLTHPLLTAAGHQVTALIRNPDHTEEVTATGAAAHVADVQSLSTEELTELFSGTDVVIWSAGAGGGDPERTRAVDQDAAVRSIDAAAAAGVQRYVMVSYFGARPDHGVPPDNGFFAYAEAKAKADEHLRSADITATILGPSGLTLEEPTGGIEAATGTDAGLGLESDTVTRADVAAVVAEVVERSIADPAALADLTIRFNNGSVPIAEALKAIADGSSLVGR